MEKDNRKKVLKDAGFAYIITFVLYLFLGTLTFNIKTQLGFVIIRSFTMPLCIFIAYSLYFGLYIREFLQQLKHDLKELDIYRILFSLKYCFLYLGIAFLITPISQIQKNSVQDGRIDLYIMLMMPIFVIFEEYIFRYILLNKFSENCTDRGILFSSIFFALMHYDRFINPLIVGIFVGIVYVYTRNIIYPIFVHYAINSMILVNLVMYVQNLSFGTHVTLETPNKMTGILLLVTAMILIVLQKLLKKGKEVLELEKNILLLFVKQIKYTYEFIKTFPINLVLFWKILSINFI